MRQKIMLLTVTMVVATTPAFAVDLHKATGSGSVNRAANDDSVIPDAPVHVRSVEPQDDHFPSPATVEGDIKAGLEDSK